MSHKAGKYQVITNGIKLKKLNKSMHKTQTTAELHYIVVVLVSIPQSNLSRISLAEIRLFVLKRQHFQVPNLKITCNTP